MESSFNQLVENPVIVLVLIGIVVTVIKNIVKFSIKIALLIFAIAGGAYWLLGQNLL